MTYGYGFIPLEHEYKLMGMAPYAPASGAEQVASIFRRYLGLDETGLRFQRRHKARINDSWGSISRDLKGIRFDYVFAGLQQFTEELLTSWVRNAVRVTGCPDVLAGGGVFMNVKANQSIAALAEIDSFQAFPSCGDETLSLGAYWMEAARRHDPAAIEPMRGFYLGDDVDDADAEKAIRGSGLAFERPASMADAVADLLVTGAPVARCSGRMEFGARALGNRSILADPSNSDVVRTINQMVKKRDFWMPFAPMIRDERVRDYVENPKGLESPYMMMTFDTTDRFREMIAAVHNADLTCRAQILDRDRNPDVYSIVEAFEARTGRGVVLNTSFNLHGFPIVRTPAEAIDVLVNSGLEHLQVGPFLVHKS